jgi:hypothetical protein
MAMHSDPKQPKRTKDPNLKIASNPTQSLTFRKPTCTNTHTIEATMISTQHCRPRQRQQLQELENQIPQT